MRECLCGDCLSCEVRAMAKRAKAKREARLLERRLELVTAALVRVRGELTGPDRGADPVEQEGACA